MLGIVKDHRSQSKFRGIIKTSPVFDDLFGIKVNKNKNCLKNVLIKLINRDYNEYKVMLYFSS